MTERILGPLHSWFFGDSSAKNVALPDPSDKITGSGDFQIVRNNDGLSVYDAAGEEILQIDNDA